jgi:phage baseplate assembly protein gpV
MSFSVPRSSRRTSGVGDFELTDTARNIGSLLRFGQVLSVNFETRTCRVQFSESLQTDDLPWLTLRAGGNAFWAAPSIDETVLVLSPSGELNNAVVLPALQTNENGTWPFNFSDLEFQWGGLGEPREGLWRWLFSDGAILENDPAKNQFRIEQQLTRLQGAELMHLRSEKFIYIEADQEQGIVHIKAPMIKLDGDVHITGQLMQTGRIIGVESDGEGLKSLDLMGDPINLNGGGGVLGILAGLLGAVSGGALSLGQLGSIMSGGANGLLGGLQNLASGVLGTGGLQNLLTAAGGLNISGIGAAMNVVGGLPVLGEVMNGLGFVGSVLQGPTGTALSALTSGSGLNLAGAFQGLSGLTGAIGDHFNIPALSNLSDLTALPALESIISGGQLTINDVMDVASGAAGAFGAPVDVTNAIGFASSAAATVAGTDPNDGSAIFEAGLTLFQNGGGAIMDGLLGNNSRVSAEQIAHKISELNLASTLESLEAAGVNGGQAIGSLISSGAITLEQVLDLSSVFQGGPDAVATAAQAMDLGKTQKFFDTFERAAPGETPARDMSSKRGSDSDPKEQQPPPDAYSDWNTVYT